MTDDVLVAITSLVKQFNGRRALNNISCQVGAGHIIGLVGPNSSGKSTLLRHIIGMLLPTQGSCRTFGAEAGKLTAEHLSRIGYVHQEPQLISWMSCGETIDYAAAHYRSWDQTLAGRLVDLFQLDLRQKAGAMSPGQKQKLSILLAVAFHPRLLILDEPASALDPSARRQFLEVLLDLIADGQKTVLISSHILSDVEKVIDHVWVLDDGRLLKDCGFDDLLDDYVRLELTGLQGELPAKLPFRHVFAREQHGGNAMVTVKRPEMTLAEIQSRLGCQVAEHALSFEEIYPLILANHPARTFGHE